MAKRLSFQNDHKLLLSHCIHSHVCISIVLSNFSKSARKKELFESQDTDVSVHSLSSYIPSVNSHGDVHLRNHSKEIAFFYAVLAS